MLTTAGTSFMKILTTKRMIIFISFVLVVWAVIFVLPLGMTDTNAYFKAVNERELQIDEIGQLRDIEEEFHSMSLAGDSFTNWNTDYQAFWKYSIAFGFYGLPSAIIINPEKMPQYKVLMDTMIWKMKSKKVWGDFTDFGFGADPISMQNIMYKGHLNLMYGLYQLSTGDMRYAKEYTWLTGQIAQEMRLHHQGIYEGVTCEPNAWFVECNTIGMLSLHIYDKLYATSYTENEVQWSLDFIMQRMQDEETGLFYRYYQPNHDFVKQEITGYANAWILTFLNPFLPEQMKQSYQSFKQNLSVNYGPYASIYSRIGHNQKPDRIAHIFGLWAAKEFNDPELFGKLRNGIDKVGDLGPHLERGGLSYDNPDNSLINGVVLASKLHLGWETVLAHDWGYAGIPYAIPDTSNMTWVDILPQQIYSSEEASPLPVYTDKRACPSCFWGDFDSEIMKKTKAEKEAADQSCSTAEGESCGMYQLLEQ